MPESRDRLRREEPMPLISPRRSVASVWTDTEQEPATWVGGVGGRNLFGSPMRVMGSRAHTPIGSPWRLRSGGQENRSLVINGRRGGRARAALRNTRSQLPSWYPRRPLQDITPIIAAIERRRSRFRDDEQHQIATPLQQLNTPAAQQEWRTPAPNASLEHSFSLISPLPIGTMKNIQLPVNLRTKTLKGNQVENETEFMTPQKKLLNSIDQVEKVMKEEFKRMRRTPIAKRAERDNKVRTLMAMR